MTGSLSWVRIKLDIPTDLFSWDVLENSGFSYDGIGNGWYNNFAGEYSQELGDICPLIIEPIGSTYITGESVQVKVMVKDARGNAIKNAAVKFYAPRRQFRIAQFAVGF